MAGIPFALLVSRPSNSSIERPLPCHDPRHKRDREGPESPKLKMRPRLYSTARTEQLVRPECKDGVVWVQITCRREQCRFLASCYPIRYPGRIKHANCNSDSSNKPLNLQLERVKGIEPSSSAWKAFAPSPAVFGVYSSCCYTSWVTPRPLSPCGNHDQRGQGTPTSMTLPSEGPDGVRARHDRADWYVGLGDRTTKQNL